MQIQGAFPCCTRFDQAGMCSFGVALNQSSTMLHIFNNLRGACPTLTINFPECLRFSFLMPESEFWCRLKSKHNASQDLDQNWLGYSFLLRWLCNTGTRRLYNIWRCQCSCSVLCSDFSGIGMRCLGNCRNNCSTLCSGLGRRSLGRRIGEQLLVLFLDLTLVQCRVVFDALIDMCFCACFVTVLSSLQCHVNENIIFDLSMVLVSLLLFFCVTILCV